MNLDDLKKYEDVILLAEIGALIHDLGKLSKVFIDRHTPEGKSQFRSYQHGEIIEYDSDEACCFHPKDKILKERAQKLKILLDNKSITYRGEKCSLHQFMKEHHTNGNTNALVRLLASCDSFDAEEDRGNASDRQSISNTYVSNAFGTEEQLSLCKEDFENERKTLYELLIGLLNTCNLKKIKEERRFFLEKLKDSFSKTLGMTARAANDVSLWEHSFMSASLMKALICESITRNCSLVENKKEIEHEKPFKILSTYWDFFKFVSQSQKIQDIRGRLEILDEIKKDIKYRIEVEYLLGNCIYEDEYGLHFLVPASFCEKNKEEIEKKIHEIFNEKMIGKSNEKLKGIIVPFIHLTHQDAYLSKLLQNALENTKKNRKTSFKPEWIEDWRKILPKNTLVCNLCGKRIYCEEEKEEICETCKSIRKTGGKQESIQTIFVDEIAWDEKEKSYGNVALFILSFKLDSWLNGVNIQSLFVKAAIEEENLSKKKGEIKNILNSKIGPLIPNRGVLSVKDLMSISDDIKNVLEEYRISGNMNDIVQGIINGIDGVPADKIDMDQILDSILSTYKYLELTSDGKSKNSSPSRLMRVWKNTKEFFEELENIICDGSYEVRRRSLIIENPPLSVTKAYELKIISDSGEIDAEGVFDGKTLHIVTPHANHFISDSAQLEVEITDSTWTLPTRTYTCKSNSSYATFKAYRSISISPDMFMFLVSASKTPKILEKIKQRYTEALGKVYGKLPLHISIVYFKRKMPLYTVLDSARRFLDYRDTKEGTGERRELTIKVEEEPKIDDSVKVKTCIGTICIPIKLGNGETDYYHPYLFVENEKDAIQVKDCKVKHATLLKEGDKLKIDPSFFDFIFLDSNTRRFDISTENKKRPHAIFMSGPRPYYLEDIDKFHQIWKILEQNCDNTQLNNFDSLLISKIEEWNLKDLKKLRENEEFKKLVEASITNILRIDKKDSECGIILKSVLSGMFFDVKELYHTILKRKLGGE